MLNFIFILESDKENLTLTLTLTLFWEGISTRRWNNPDKNTKNDLDEKNTNSDENNNNKNHHENFDKFGMDEADPNTNKSNEVLDGLIGIVYMCGNLCVGH